MSPTTFAHNSGMGGTYIALKPDSTMPIFINTGNPASYSLIKLTTLEVGGSFLNSNFNIGNVFVIMTIILCIVVIVTIIKQS